VIQATKGEISTKGQRLAAAAFSGSMYFDFLYRTTGLRFGNVWVWRCSCKPPSHNVAAERCATSGKNFNPSRHRGREERAQLFIPAELEGTHKLEYFWTCPKIKGGKQCSNVYEDHREKCPLSSCSGHVEETSKPSALWRNIGQWQQTVLASDQDPREVLERIISEGVDLSQGSPEEDRRVMDFILDKWPAGSLDAMTPGDLEKLVPRLRSLLSEGQPQLPAEGDRAGEELLLEWAQSVKIVRLHHWSGKSPDDIVQTLHVPRKKVDAVFEELENCLDSGPGDVQMKGNPI
jgi:hypothetical protein